MISEVGPRSERREFAEAGNASGVIVSTNISDLTERTAMLAPTFSPEPKPPASPTVLTEAKTTLSKPSVETAVDRLLAKQFSHPKLWGEGGEWRLEETDQFGVHREESGSGQGAATWQLDHPEKIWVAGLTGVNVNKISSDPLDATVTLETTDLRMLRSIQEAVATTVLEGENARPIVLVDPPSPAKEEFDFRNNDAWLKAWADGYCPVVKITDEEGESSYNGHDLGLHATNAMLLPRELQDMITQAAQIELDWRQNYFDRTSNHSEPTRPKYLLLYEDLVGKKNPAVVEHPAMDGIGIIDYITDGTTYSDLVAYLVDETDIPVEERMQMLLSQEASVEDEHPLSLIHI